MGPRVKRPQPLAAALDYASRYGWPVFPLRQKKPAIRSCHPKGDPLHNVCKGTCGRIGHGYHDAASDPEGIRTLWRQAPGADGVGVNLAAAGLVLVDVDPRHGGSMADLGPMPRTAKARTGGGGWHLFYTRPDDCPAKSGGNLLGPGLDVKASGYAVLAPSSHPSGGTYRWLRPPDDAPLAECPRRVVEALQAKAAPKPEAAVVEPRQSPAPGVSRLIDTVARKLASTARGDRDNALNRAAYYLGRKSAGEGITRDAACSALRWAAEANGYNAEAGHDFEGTFSRGWEAGLAVPIAASPRPSDNRRSEAELRGAVRRLIRTPEVRREWGRGYRSARVVIDALLNWAESRGRSVMSPGNGYLSATTGLGRKTVGKALARASEPLECLGGRPILVRVADPECSQRRWRAARWQLDNNFSQKLPTNYLSTVGLGDNPQVPTVGSFCEKGRAPLLAAPPPAECDVAVHVLAARALATKGGPLAGIGQAGADVLAALAELGGGSADDVASAAGVCRNTAARHLARAEAVGYVTVGHEATAGRTRAVYRLAVEASEALGLGGPVCRALKARRRAAWDAERAATRAYLARGGDPEADAERARRAVESVSEVPTPREFAAAMVAAWRLVERAGLSDKVRLRWVAA